MRTLNLERLRGGIPALTPAVGNFLAEAAMVCLIQQGHTSGVILKVEGYFNTEFEVTWSLPEDQWLNKSWQDLRVAAEYGGMALTILAFIELTGYNYFERIQQGSGFDFWLGTYEEEEWKFQEKPKVAKLEASGIFSETRGNTISMRISKKKKQTGKFSGVKIPVFIAVIEFKSPKAKIIKE